MQPLGELGAGVGAGRDQHVVEWAGGCHRRPDDLGLAGHQPGDERGRDTGDLPVSAVDHHVPRASVPDRPDAGGERPERERSPVEGEQAIDCRVSVEDPRGLLVDQHVHRRSRPEPLQGERQRRDEQRLAHALVDADQQDPAHPGWQRGDRPAEDPCRRPGQGPLPGAFQSLVPGFHAFGP